jgi:hypothetical protein
MKPGAIQLGYERHRRTKLSDRQIEQVFEAFCYKTKALSKTSLERNAALSIVQKAITASQIECDAEAFIADIKKVTCLVSEEGGRIEFLHQSVQEFFAARYIKSRPEGVARLFYEQLGTDARWQNWQQELTFLAQIDKYRASKYCFMPLISKTLNYLNSAIEPANSAFLKFKISDNFAIRQDFLGSDGKPLLSPKYYIRNENKPSYFMINVFESRMFSLLFGTRKWRSAFDGITQHQLLTYSQIAERCGVSVELEKLLAGATTYLLSELKRHDQSVKAADDSNVFVNL